jgi:glycogen debranching enzyme
MPPGNTPLLIAASLLFVANSAITPHTLSAQSFTSIPAIAFDSSGPVIQAHTEAFKPFTVAGQRGVLLGAQDGVFESWILPVKLLSHMTLEATVEGYSVPIDVNQQSAAIEVRPDRTVITYSHIAFTVRQIMFSPDDAAPGTGPLVLFQFDCLHPTDFTFRFTPNLEWMWPKRNEGIPGVEWVAHLPATAAAAPVAAQAAPEATSGFYVLHADYPDLAGALTIPAATPGILAPYQERPQVHPVELHLHIDPIRDHAKLFPLLMAVGMNTEAAQTPALAGSLQKLNQTIAASYQAHIASYHKTLQNSVSIETPDKSLDEAFQWAEISIEQLRARVPEPHRAAPDLFTAQAPTPSSPGPSHLGTWESTNPETALVAGYYASGDSARPGFGWFFGRDALYTLFAVNSYGDFALSRDELNFLIRRQRPDGKIMHEYSQTAADIDWQAFPYMYAAADATPLFLLAVEDYVRASGDMAFLTTHRDAIEKAWSFETDPAHDTDHDGIYDNSQGTGWVESWPGGMPHQEIYLALLDEQASAAMANLEDLLKNPEKSLAAKARANTIAKTIETEYYDPEKSCYAFSRNLDGSEDRTTTIYPAIAWWSASPAGSQSNEQSSLKGTGLSPNIDSNHAGSVLAPEASVPRSFRPAAPAQPLVHGDQCLKQFAQASLATDWGLRDVANTEKIYDGMSYHQGSVWPLFTGWAALAEYRGNQPLAGYQMLKENANLTRVQDLGADTELLSGDFNVPFGRSTSHQLWSSAMVITPTLRGLFGITIDAQKKEITVNPHLPAAWGVAHVENIHVPDGGGGLMFERKGRFLSVSLFNLKGWKLRSNLPGSEPEPKGTGWISIRIPLPLIEVDQDPGNIRLSAGREDLEPKYYNSPITPGQTTRNFRVVSEQLSDHKFVLEIQGPSGSSGAIDLVRHAKFIPKAAWKLNGLPDDGKTKGDLFYFPAAVGDESKPLLLTFDFPEGTGWQTITVTLTW